MAQSVHNDACYYDLGLNIITLCKYMLSPCFPFTFTYLASCKDDYTETANAFLLGGILETGVSTNRACNGACSTKVSPRCTGYDYNSRQNLCYLHLSPTLGTPSSSQDINHYRRSTYRCFAGRHL